MRVVKRYGFELWRLFSLQSRSKFRRNDPVSVGSMQGH